jgi:hypothetical protein
MLGQRRVEENGSVVSIHDVNRLQKMRSLPWGWRSGAAVNGRGPGVDAYDIAPEC